MTFLELYQQCMAEDAERAIRDMRAVLDRWQALDAEDDVTPDAVVENTKEEHA